MAAVSFLGVTPIYAAGALDQSQTNQTAVGQAGAAILGVEAQAFTAGITGNLDQLNLAIATFAPAGTLIIEIRTVDGSGLPTAGPALGGTTVPLSTLPITTGAPPIAFTSFPLNPPVQVVAGIQYAIVISTTVSNVDWAYSTGDPYPGGRASVSVGGGPFTYLNGPAGLSDFAFQTFVTAASLSVSGAQLVEGNAGTTNLVFPVTLSFPVAAAVTAPYTLANGSAVGGATCSSGVDYVNTGGIVTVAAGGQTASISVPVCGETALEANESLIVSLGAPTNARLGTAQANGIILDDDAALLIRKNGPATVVPGSSLVYTIIVTNNRDVPATNVVLTDPTPTDLVFVSNTGACTTPFPCDLGTLAGGASVTVTATYTIPGGYNGPDPIQNTATVSAAGVAANRATATTVPLLNLPQNPANNQSRERTNEDERMQRTEEQIRNEQLTNAGHRGDVSTEGNVIAVERAPDDAYVLVTIGLTRKETLVVQVWCTRGSVAFICPDVHPGDYLEADGYQNGVGDANAYFVAPDGITVTRNGKRVK